jgi:hypothetical protein
LSAGLASDAERLKHRRTDVKPFMEANRKRLQDRWLAGTSKILELIFAFERVQGPLASRAAPS